MGSVACGRVAVREIRKRDVTTDRTILYWGTTSPCLARSPPAGWATRRRSDRVLAPIQRGLSRWPAPAACRGNDRADLRRAGLSQPEAITQIDGDWGGPAWSCHWLESGSSAGTRGWRGVGA